MTWYLQTAGEDSEEFWDDYIHAGNKVLARQQHSPFKNDSTKAEDLVVRLTKQVRELEKWRECVDKILELMTPIGTAKPVTITPVISQVTQAGVKDKPILLNKTSITGAGSFEDHTKLKADGQQQGYLVLTEAERAQGFVRPVRNAYTHRGKLVSKDGWTGANRSGGCGVDTTMAREIAETFARDPDFYSGTFCAGCKTHLPLDEFVWKDTDEELGS